MDFDENIKEFGPVNIFDLLDRVRSMSDANWQIKSRKKLAGNRPGNAVFFINDCQLHVLAGTLSKKPEEMRLTCCTTNTNHCFKQ